MSEAAKPADPERALARLEMLLRQAERIPDPGKLAAYAFAKDELGHAAGWLLPLARAGLRCQTGACAVADTAMPEHRVEALEREFEACVRVLARLTEIDVLSTDGVTYRLTASSVAAIALAQPLAAAVLRSPEPATPADGGA